jgi:hypothetical protein
MCCMGNGSTHLSTWVSEEIKQRFASASQRQGLSESALLKRLVEQMLSAGAADPAPAPPPPLEPRDARLTIRLVPEDRLLLRERSAARAMPSATYVSILVRAHLRAVVPLPEAELTALRRVVSELSAVGRNLNQIVRAVHDGNLRALPDRHGIFAMLRVCEGLRDHVRALIRANITAWEAGHADDGR